MHGLPIKNARGREAERLRIVALIPAYNEEKTLGAVIDCVRSCDVVQEVIVISDGSTDRTAEVARRCGVSCIELEQNVGKGGAMKAGIERADADVFLFLDADLVGLQPEHIYALLQPILSGRAAMSVGLFERGRLSTDFAQVVAPYLSGQRAVRREVLQGISGLDMARFGVEIALTRYIREHDIPVEEVILENLTHLMKEEKLGLLRGFMARMKMYWEIVRFSQVR